MANNEDGLLASAGRYIRLLIEDTRLNVAEKLTLLCSGVAVSAVLAILCTVAMVFISIGVAFLIAQSVGILWAFIIVAAFYVLLIALVIVFKQQIFTDPIARFISSLIVTPPTKPATKDKDNAESASVS